MRIVFLSKYIICSKYLGISLLLFDAANIREIGLRCDGVYKLESIDADLQQQFKYGSTLKWFPNRQQCENGKSLDTILAIDSMAHEPIKFIVFVFEGTNFELDLQAWRPVSQHVCYVTLPTAPCYSTGQLHSMEGEKHESLIPFKRVAVQVQTTQREYIEVLNNITTVAESLPICEAAEVLADALEFTVRHGEEPMGDRLRKVAVCNPFNISSQTLHVNILL